jgi:hypothetical protein
MSVLRIVWREHDREDDDTEEDREDDDREEDDDRVEMMIERSPSRNGIMHTVGSSHHAYSR